MGKNLKKHRYQFGRIQVKGVSPRIKKAIQNIAKNKGITVSQLLKTRLHEVANSSNGEDMDLLSELERLEITGVSKDLKTKWSNIAKNKGFNLSQMVKIEAFKIVSEATEREKRPYVD